MGAGEQTRFESSCRLNLYANYGEPDEHRPEPLIALIAGILILVMPRLLNYIVAFYLIIIGLVGLFGGGANFTL